MSKIKKSMIDYEMVAEGDRIAVGLSGGKDSGVLLYALERIRRTVPFKFEIQGVFLDLGFGMDISSLESYCRKMDLPFTHKKTDIGEIVFDIRKEKNPCSLCSNLRRGALNELALELGCNKVALGHHLDDLVETFFLSLIYAGKLETFSPNTYLDRTNLHVIRPLVYLEGEYISQLAITEKVPIIKNPCPANGITKREEIKELMADLREKYPDLRGKVLAALKNSDASKLWSKALS
ncbi:MAG: tRNA 2-thiocytidine(32) synthetase TtcA [Peptococcaceae bacterium]|nr:tRNA 2-thiocytidine(32) synthetase TtcA [Peptococcaceae bacterium]